MNIDDVYEDWKRQRAEVEVPVDFCDRVVQAIDTPEQSESPVELASATASSWSHRFGAIAAVCAALIMGIVRVAGSLLLGILGELT